MDPVGPPRDTVLDFCTCVGFPCPSDVVCSQSVRRDPRFGSRVNPSTSDLVYYESVRMVTTRDLITVAHTPPGVPWTGTTGTTTTFEDRTVCMCHRPAISGVRSLFPGTTDERG